MGINMNKKRGYVIAASTAFCLLGASLAMLSLVDSGYEITQLRNALIRARATHADFAWKPDAIPDGFHQETGTPPPEFLEAAAQVLASIPADAGDLDRTLALARHLASGPGRGGGIRSSTREAYKEILSESRGYCSDYTQVLNGLAYAAEIPVREWGMSFDDYSGYGHAFSEIYDRSMEQWVLIDSFYSLYFADRASLKPLSALGRHSAESIRSYERWRGNPLTRSATSSNL